MDYSAKGPKEWPQKCYVYWISTSSTYSPRELKHLNCFPKVIGSKPAAGHPSYLMTSFNCIGHITRVNIRGLFKNFVDSPYYSESELCGGAVTVSFSKYPPSQAMHFLQRSTHFSKTCCRPFAASFRRTVEQEVLTSGVPFYGWKSPEIAWGEIWTVWRMF
jgi:hypothetical protein